MNEAFTTDNFKKLKQTCKKIAALADENVDGNLMFTQAQLLGDNIKEFVENPIVKTSRIIKSYEY